MKRNCQRFVIMPALGCLGLMILLAGLSSILPTKETPTATVYLEARGAAPQQGSPESSATLPARTAAPTLAPTVKPSPTATTPPKVIITPISVTTRYITATKVNVRECPGVDCATISQLSYGDSIRVDGQGNDSDGEMWYRFDHDGEAVWVAGWVTSANEPVIAAPTAQPVQPGQSSSEQAAPAAPVDRSSSEFVCNCGKTCDQMSCTEAYFQLNQCGCKERDHNNDGVPCEDICGG